MCKLGRRTWSRLNQLTRMSYLENGDNHMILGDWGGTTNGKPSTGPAHLRASRNSEHLLCSVLLLKRQLLVSALG